MVISIISPQKPITKTKGKKTDEIESEEEEEEEDPTSIFESSIYSLFDIHIAATGDPGSEIIYKNEKLIDLLDKGELKYLIPKGDKEQNGLMANFQWDAGLVLSDLICENSISEQDQERRRKEDEKIIYKYNSNESGSSNNNIDRSNKDIESNFDHPFKVKDKSTLELGSGTGLCSLVALAIGSELTVITDYPSPDILKTLKQNIEMLEEQLSRKNQIFEKEKGLITDLKNNRRKAFVEGLDWGNKSHEDLALKHLSTKDSKFDLVLTTDTLWLTRSHISLIKTLKRTLKLNENSRILLVAGFHTGRKVCSNFFEKILKSGFDELSKKEFEIEIDDQESQEEEQNQQQDEEDKKEVSDLKKKKEGRETIEIKEEEEERTILNKKLIPDSKASKFGGIWERNFKGEEREYLDWNQDWLKKKEEEKIVAEEKEEEEDNEEVKEKKRKEKLKFEEMNDDRDRRAEWCVIACLKWEEFA